MVCPRHSWHTNSVCNAKPQELSGCTIAQEDYVLSVTFPRCGHFIDADHVSVASEATTAAVGTKLSHMRRTLEAFKLLQFWDGFKDETAGSSDILATSSSLSCHCPCSCRLAALRFTGSIDQQQALGLLTYYVCLKSFLGGGAGYYWALLGRWGVRSQERNFRNRDAALALCLSVYFGPLRPYHLRSTLFPACNGNLKEEKIDKKNICSGYYAYCISAYMRLWLVNKVITSLFILHCTIELWSISSFYQIFGLFLNLPLCIIVLQVSVFSALKVTSLLPVLLLPLFGIMGTGEVSKVFTNRWWPFLHFSILSHDAY